jgi:hypothetical protein
MKNWPISVNFYPKIPKLTKNSHFPGTGFKFGVGIGEIVSDLIDNKRQKLDISRFSALRNTNLSKSKL